MSPAIEVADPDAHPGVPGLLARSSFDVVEAVRYESPL